MKIAQRDERQNSAACQFVAATWWQCTLYTDCKNGIRRHHPRDWEIKKINLRVIDNFEVFRILKFKLGNLKKFNKLRLRKYFLRIDI